MSVVRGMKRPDTSSLLKASYRYFHDILFPFHFSFITLHSESNGCFLRGAAVVAVAEIIPMNLIRVMPA